MATHLLINPSTYSMYIYLMFIYFQLVLFHKSIKGFDVLYLRKWMPSQEALGAKSWVSFAHFSFSSAQEKERRKNLVSNVHQKNVWTTYERLNKTLGNLQWHFQKIFLVDLQYSQCANCCNLVPQPCSINLLGTSPSLFVAKIGNAKIENGLVARSPPLLKYDILILFLT